MRLQSCTLNCPRSLITVRFINEVLKYLPKGGPSISSLCQIKIRLVPSRTLCTWNWPSTNEGNSRIRSIVRSLYSLLHTFRQNYLLHVNCNEIVCFRYLEFTFGNCFLKNISRIPSLLFVIRRKKKVTVLKRYFKIHTTFSLKIISSVEEVFANTNFLSVSWEWEITIWCNNLC